MQDDQQTNLLAAAFPAPPPFYTHFTQSNLTRLEELRNESQSESEHTVNSSQKSSREGTADEDAPKSEIRLADLPLELRYLIPPDPPTTGRYRSFGGQFDVSLFCPQKIRF